MMRYWAFLSVYDRRMERESRPPKRHYIKNTFGKVNFLKNIAFLKVFLLFFCQKPVK